MLYLLDANLMIRAHEDYYPIDRIPQFWTWLASLGANGTVKVPHEIYQEIAVSTGPLHDWLTDMAISEAMLLDMTTDPSHLNQVLTGGYGRVSDVCRTFGIRCMSDFEFYRELNFKIT